MCDTICSYHAFYVLTQYLLHLPPFNKSIHVFTPTQTHNNLAVGIVNLVKVSCAILTKMFERLEELRFVVFSEDSAMYT